MSVVIFAIVPIFGLILFGWILYRLDFPGQGFWPVSERLTYYILLPALLVQGLSGRTFQADGLPLAGAVFLAVLSSALLARIVWPLLKLDGPAYTSLFQGAFRPNSYVGLSIAASLLGPDWMTLSAVALLTMIPIINVLCVLTLSRHGTPVGPNEGVAVKLAKNPLILACVVGLTLNVLHVPLPAMLSDFLDILGRAALPMGLLAVGAGLRLEKVVGGKRSLIASSLIHLVLFPLMAAGYCTLFGGSANATLTAVIYTAIPVSVSSFILARQMGGDHRLMSQIITFQTLLSAISLPVILGLLR
ncbi:AEC family transporter [Pseudodesulfovibrio sp. JC047]|uniref:AEC family transporter n=1 Tax=Pseudodesulfovibrio sp. JC047 TaxID=2683199 RepID=UPI0013D6484B|nr:AEC family transporter [Pseudodesulfovibrio sp. JC047]NDV20382.1 AEC family transporter [Pseudodesulfovibrio sp. JC047]